ncbi:MBL fold metallo-hydrolase [Cytophagaceae bacterium DM2B3-1]|uniref:MBL fold metallo-hydrolase n=1 Tax=Xanthocytophaga flava TaxID=3048013 RepID=A0ABT7CIP2_9BACT|nr:MBL fold metallo-hydrolase [Xanthocytophaga flavus]MDJ1493585.1 MBL fold metallo-hydrolase [Xanthocytophaga flavus]
MKIQLIRNATLKFYYGGNTFLIDPYFASKHSQRSFAGKSPNPTVELPVSVEDILSGVEMVLVSHLHPDHFDETAQLALPKELPLFCHPTHLNTILGMNFTRITSVEDQLYWRNLEIIRTPGEHGVGEIGQRMGDVAGFILKAAGEPTIYWMGDTIWYSKLEEVIETHKPHIIITHSGGNRFSDDTPAIVMDKEQTIDLCKFTPDSIVIATHLEALDHGSVTRDELQVYAEKQGVPASQLRIPADGELLEF